VAVADQLIYRTLFSIMYLRVIYSIKKALASLQRRLQTVMTLQSTGTFKDQRQAVWLAPFEENHKFYVEFFTHLVSVSQ
jgi:hypothetical protein